MLRIVKGILYILAAYKWGDWKNWKIYYPTILFWILGDYIYGYLTYNYPLWELISPGGKVTFNTMFVDFITFPATVLLFLGRFPEKGSIAKKGIFILAWVALFSTIEFIALKIGHFRYYHGWNLYWSIGFNIYSFLLLRIHFKNPLLAWFFAALLGISIIFYFKIPISSMK
ncbi:CBO0543 family protein [Desulfosporosinus lacus]|uniref:Uncharacterized protein n=1 Tax=Desulfosporosinus lacus DSM 15449 TaxID=1121420 RepID=A0A1M6DWN9_9FIRM|nr:CBO0543 family protein [Desulfosporosinus lacus]SHI77540.1 hypothetical protein SAMN02746098_04608 [Desulfosporosinus lacus DSM 15449]